MTDNTKTALLSHHITEREREKERYGFKENRRRRRRNSTIKRSVFNLSWKLPESMSS
jgi:hypothetical protein